MTVRAKLKLTAITEKSWGNGIVQKTLRFDAIYDPSVPEDQRFQKATPSAFAEFVIDNQAALSQFKIGEDYYVDFRSAS